jgi:outer membrane receptor protein involved in Fe transport
MINHRRVTRLSIILLLGLSISAFAQEKAKISGRVTDAATKEALPSVNVTIEGTTYGAATDANGEYFIVNLAPGTYTVVASMIGYSKVRFENVSVNTGRTTIINIQLSSKSIIADEVVVVARRPVIQQDISNSQEVAYGKDIAVLPTVVDIRGFVALQAGVEGLSVRGGSIDQTSVMIDGAVVVDPTTNTPYTSIPLAAVQEVSVIKGGFNAEYGNIRSGLINITTKDGDKSRYHFSADFRLSPAHQKHFGPSYFSPDSYYLRPYFDPQVAFTGTQNWPEWMRQQYPEGFQGWNKWAQENSQWGVTPQQAQQIFMWTHTVGAKADWGIIGCEALGQRPRTEGTHPDLNGEASVSGPLPFLSDLLGDLTFFGSYKGNSTYFAVPFTRENNLQQDYQIKLVSHATNSMKFSVQGIYSELKGVNYNLGDGVDGSFMGESNALYQANYRNSYYFWQSSFSPLDLYRSVVSVNFEHVLSPSTFYSFKVAFGTDNYKANGYLDERDTTTQIILGKLRLNGIPWGWTGDPFQQMVDQPDRRTFGGDNGGMIWDRTRANTLNLKLDLFSQLNSYHGIKAGFDLNFTAMYVDRAKYKSRSQLEVTTLPPPSDWFSLKFNAYPILGAFYLQDKIELLGMIANLGLRADYFNTNTIDYFVDPFSRYYGQQYASVFTDSIPQASVKGTVKLSPRIGVAFPISENAKLFFNYGHFYSYPMSSDLYGQLRGQNQVITKVGNPAAMLPKTVAYELGVEINLSNTYLLTLTGYYKDVVDQLTSVQYVSTGSISYSTVQNQNIADIRGLEVKLEKRMGEWMRGWVNFTYMSTNNGDIGRGVYYQQDERNVREGYLNYDASYRKPVPQPYARASVEFSTPRTMGDLWGDWHLTLLPSWKSGSYYSYSPTGVAVPEFANNIHWPDSWDVDMRLTKYVSLMGLDCSFYMEANNLFNFKNFNPSTYYGFSDSYDRDFYLRSLHLPLYSGAVYQAAGLTAGDDKVGELRSDAKPYINDPNLTHSLWGITREITFGIQIIL